MDAPAQTPDLPPSPHPIEHVPATHKKGYPMTLKIIFIFIALIIIGISVGGGMILYNAKNQRTNHKNPIQQIQEMLQPGSTNQTTSNTTTGSSTEVTPNPTTSVNQGTTNQTNSQPGPTTAQKNTTSSNGSQWKTYENTAEKFSIPYPANLDEKENSYGMGVINIQISDSDGPQYQMLTFPKIIGSTIGQDFDGYYDMTDGSTKVLTGQDGSSQLFTKLHNRSIGSLRAFDYKTTSNPPKADEEAEVGTYIEIGNNILVTSTAESNRTILDTMLSSFKYPL